MISRLLFSLSLLLAACTASTPSATSMAPTLPALPLSQQPPVATRETIAADSSPTPTLSRSGNVFYVATNGDDANAGTADRPWRSIQHAADTMSPGDTVFIRGGTYHESVTISQSRLAFIALPDEAVILDGGGTLGYGFQSSFADPDPQPSDNIIGGFTIRNYTANGVALWSVNDRWMLENLSIQNNGDFAILVSNSDGTTVQNVVMEHNNGGFSCSPILPPDGPGCTNLHIVDSQAVDNGAEGDTGVDAFAVERGDKILVERSLAAGGPGDGFDFKSDHTTLSQVIAHHTRNNIKMWGKESLVANALAYDAYADANLVLAAGGSYTIVNVTVANMAATAYLVTVGDPGGKGATPVRIFNSIFYNDNPAMEGTLLWFGPTVRLTADNNLYFNPYRTDAVICAEFAPLNGQCFSDGEISDHKWVEAGGQYANPNFANPTDKDFHLKDGSPAINAGGAQDAPANDLAGQPRNDRPDIGAYEHRP